MDKTLAPDEAKSGDSAKVSDEDRADTQVIMHGLTLWFWLMSRKGFSLTSLYNGILNALVEFDTQMLKAECIHESQLPMVFQAYADEIESGKWALANAEPEGEA